MASAAFAEKNSFNLVVYSVTIHIKFKALLKFSIISVAFNVSLKMRALASK